MARITVDVSTAFRGLRAFEKRAEREIGLAVEATAIEMQDAVREPRESGGRMPVDTSTLQRSVSVRKGEGDSAETPTREVFTNVEYAARQNFGFVGTDSLGRTYNQAGNFFMEAGLDKGRQVLPARVASAIERAGGS